MFDSVKSIQTGLTTQNLPCISTHTAILLTTGPYCLGITEHTLNKMVLSSKIYKEAFCLLVGGLCDLKHTECWYFQPVKKEKEIQFIVASQTVKLNLFIWNKMRFLRPSVWHWWTWLRGYNSLCFIPRCVLPGFSLLKAFVFSSLFPGGQVLKKSFHHEQFQSGSLWQEEANPVQCLDFPQGMKWKIRRIFNLFLWANNIDKS